MKTAALIFLLMAGCQKKEHCERWCINGFASCFEETVCWKEDEGPPGMMRVKCPCLPSPKK